MYHSFFCINFFLILPQLQQEVPVEVEVPKNVGKKDKYVEYNDSFTTSVTEDDYNDFKPKIKAQEVMKNKDKLKKLDKEKIPRKTNLVEHKASPKLEPIVTKKMDLKKRKEKNKAQVNKQLISPSINRHSKSSTSPKSSKSSKNYMSLKVLLMIFFIILFIVSSITVYMSEKNIELAVLFGQIKQRILLLFENE